MNVTLRKSHLSCHMKRQNRLMQWVSGTGCLMKPSCVLFFDPNDIRDEFAYSVDGLDQPGCCVIDGSELILQNYSKEKVKFMFPSAKSALRWQNELIQSAKELL